MTPDDPIKFERNEFALLRQQLFDTPLRSPGLCNKRVLAAMAAVPREKFVCPQDIGSADADCALSIDCGQTTAWWKSGPGRVNKTTTEPLETRFSKGFLVLVLPLAR